MYSHARAVTASRAPPSARSHRPLTPDASSSDRSGSGRSRPHDRHSGFASRRPPRPRPPLSRPRSTHKPLRQLLELRRVILLAEVLQRSDRLQRRDAQQGQGDGSEELRVGAERTLHRPERLHHVAHGLVPPPHAAGLHALHLTTRLWPLRGSRCRTGNAWPWPECSADNAGKDG
jgi:hypothetical protein